MSEEDVFKRQKIISMIKLLERIIEFAEKYDSAREFIKQSLKRIKIRARPKVSLK